MSQSFIVLALIFVSRVVNVLLTTIAIVSSGFSLSVALFTSTGSTLLKKRSILSPAAAEATLSVLRAFGHFAYYLSHYSGNILEIYIYLMKKFRTQIGTTDADGYEILYRSTSNSSMLTTSNTIGK